LIDSDIPADLKERQNVLPRHRRINRKKVVDALAGLEKIDQRLKRNPRLRETRRPVHHLTVDADHASQRIPSFRSHISSICNRVSEPS
jgi:hypothetical protein